MGNFRPLPLYHLNLLSQTSHLLRHEKFLLYLLAQAKLLIDKDSLAPYNSHLLYDQA